MSFLGWGSRKKDTPAASGPATPSVAGESRSQDGSLEVKTPPGADRSESSGSPAAPQQASKAEAPRPSGPKSPAAPIPAEAVSGARPSQDAAKPASPIAPAVPVVPGSTLSIKGDVETAEDFAFTGKLEGSITANGYEVTVSGTARIKGNVTAKVVVVSGRVDGVIRASDEIELLATASVNGEMVAPRIGIATGAQLRAKVNTSNTETAMAVAQHRQRSEQQRKAQAPEKSSAAAQPAAAAVVHQPSALS